MSKRLEKKQPHEFMTIDLNAELLAFRAYACRVVVEYIEAGEPKPKLMLFGFTFDQDGWISTYLDSRLSASCDAEWTMHISPNTLLPRPHWYEASEVVDQHNVNITGVNGERVTEWADHPDSKTFANILCDFIRSSVAVFLNEGVFRLLLGSEHIEYYVEKLSGLYGWPEDPEKVKFAESLRAHLTKEAGLDPKLSA